MNESIQINENNKDMFNINIPSFDAGTEIPSPPVSQPSEIETFTSKSITSFGTMAICIVLFLVIAFIFKRKKEFSSNLDYNIENENQNTIENSQDNNIVSNIASKNRNSYLNTPSSIQKCIKSFLENTKEN
ncbi:TPA: hypothetical protein IAA87_02520 [Candidatus Avigastranaerophilus faecigallinarum]|nr:hypothetical protein [Candidatus Avigastranaerophilus faecigallinarum]